MNWRTDKPTEKVIVAKLTEDFCHIKDNYSLLYLTDKPYQHYCEYGEEIPYSAIEKWASLEEDKLPEGLEEAAVIAACNARWLNLDKEDNFGFFTNSELEELFIAGAKWDRAKMMEMAVEGEVIGYDDGTGKFITVLEDLPDDSPYKVHDKVKLIIIPK